MEGWLLNALTVGASLVAAFAVAKYRIDRLEKDQEKDDQNFQRIVSDLTARIEAADGRMRQHSGNLYEAVDDVRRAGGILESRVSAIETTLRPDRVHEHNQRLGANEARISHIEKGLARVEDHLLEEIRSRRP